jgi:hypothetical protein
MSAILESGGVSAVVPRRGVRGLLSGGPRYVATEAPEGGGGRYQAWRANCHAERRAEAVGSSAHALSRVRQQAPFKAQGPCPHLVEGDIRVLTRGAGFDPLLTRGQKR